MRSGRKADVASTRLSSSEATVIYNEVAPTALLKSEMRRICGRISLLFKLPLVIIIIIVIVIDWREDD
jgi:hypothetical protein